MIIILMLVSTKPQKNKRIIYFIPHYIGSLKYFEKILPYISDDYKVVFLLICEKANFHNEMKDYCNMRNLNYFTIDRLRISEKIRKHMYYVSFAIDIYYYQKRVQHILKQTSIHAFISVGDAGVYMRHLFLMANERGIKTKVLQWAATLTKRPNNSQTQKKTKIQKIVSFGRAKIRLFIYKLMLHKKVIEKKDMPGTGECRQIGLINKKAQDYYLQNGVLASKISVVGHIDFDTAYRTRARIEKDNLLKKKLALKYGIDPTKKNVIIYSSPFNGKDIKVLSDEEQLELTCFIIKLIRKELPKTDYDILFKPHPSEQMNFYDTLKTIDVKVFDGSAVNEELIALSALYVAGGSSVNFIAQIMQKHALFVNFLNLYIIQSATAHFGITNMITDWHEFTRLLKLYKKGALKKQYHVSEDFFSPDSIKKITNWIQS